MAMASCESLEHPDLEDMPESSATLAWRTVTYLRLDPEEECYGNTHLAYMLLIALPSFLAYAVGLPVGATLILWRNREFHKGKKYIFRMGLLYSGYRKERWWWECIVVLRKLFIIFFASFFYNDELQLQLTLGMIFAAFVVHHLYAPFPVDKKNRLLDALERNSIVVSTFLLWSATVFLVNPTCEHGFCYFLILATMISNIVFLVSGTWYYAHYFLKQHHKLLDHVKRKLMRNSLVPVNPLWNGDRDKGKGQGEGKLNWRAGTLKEAAQKVKLANMTVSAMSTTENVGYSGGREIELSSYFSTAIMNRAARSGQARSHSRNGKATPAEVRRFYRMTTDDGETYFVPEDHGDSVWELPKGSEVIDDAPAENSALGNLKFKAAVKKIRLSNTVLRTLKRNRQYSRGVTDDGDVYYTPEDGGESVWDLPDGATVLET